MTENDAAPKKDRPLPGHETQSPEMACPKCGRFVGAVSKCPYCGAKVEKRMSLVALRWAAVLLSTVGLVLLWLMAKTREPELVKIGDIETTMNFGVVRLAGVVQNDPRPYKSGNGMSFHVKDDTGSIIVFVDQAQRKAMADGGLTPHRGDKIEFSAHLQSSSDGHSARIRSLDPSSFKLTPSSRKRANRAAETAKDLGPVVPFSSIDESLVGKSVVLEGTVASIKEPPPESNGPYVVTLTNATDGVDLKVWPDKFAQIADAASLTGTPVRVKVSVKPWRDKIDLQLKNGEDIQRVDRSAKKARKPVVPVAQVTKADANGWVTVEGALSDSRDLKGKGTSCKLTDDSGSILVVFWNDDVPTDLQQKAAAAKRVRVNGRVQNYKDTTLEVVPRADGLEILE